MNFIQEKSWAGFLAHQEQKHTLVSEFTPYRLFRPTGPRWFVCEDVIQRCNGLIRFESFRFHVSPESINEILYDTTKNRVAFFHNDGTHTRFDYANIPESEVRYLANHLDISYYTYPTHPVSKKDRHEVPDFVLEEKYGRSEFGPATFDELLNSHASASTR